MSIGAPAGAKPLGFGALSSSSSCSSSCSWFSSSSCSRRTLMASMRTSPSSSFPFFLRRRFASSVMAMAAAAASSSSSSSSAAVKPLTGIMKPVPVSPDLQAFLGIPQCSRAQALKLVWAYVKEHKLQSETDKKVIVCDEKLKGILGKDEVGMLEVTKLLSPHFKKKNEA